MPSIATSLTGSLTSTFADLPNVTLPMSDRIHPAPPPATDVVLSTSSHRFAGGADTNMINTTISPRESEAAMYHSPSHATEISSQSAPSNAYFQPSPNRSQHPLNGANGQQRRADKGRRPKAVSNAVIAAKTRLCVKFEKGTCTSPTCTFAHGSMELRKKPDLRKTKLCESFSAVNSCAKGSECTYAHGIHELQATSEYFKTSICPNWKQGHCDAGAHCRHAHGTQELRVRPPVPKRTLPMHNVEISELPGTPESSSRFASATNVCEEKSKLLSAEPAMGEESVMAAPRAPPSHPPPVDSANDLPYSTSNQSSMLMNADEPEELLHQPSSFPLVSMPAADHRAASLSSTNIQMSMAPCINGYQTRPNPPGTSSNRVMPTRIGTMPAGWQSSARNINRGPSYPSSDPHYMTFHEPSTESSQGFASADGVLFKSSSLVRRSLVSSAPAPPPPPPEPDGMASGTLLPKPPTTPVCSGNPRHQRQISEVSSQRGLRRPHHSDDYIDMRGPSASGSRAWNKQIASNQQQQTQNSAGARSLAWRGAQHQPDVQQYDHRSSSNHSRAGASVSFRSQNVVMNRQPTSNKPNKMQAQSVVESHSVHPSQPLLLFVNSSNGLPPSAGANGADTESLSPIEYPPSAVAASEPYPVNDSTAFLSNTVAMKEDKNTNQRPSEDMTASEADPGLTPSNTLHLNRPVFGYFPFDLPTVKESVPAVSTSAQTPIARGEVHDAASLMSTSNNKGSWTLCYGDRRASSIEFNPGNMIEGHSWGTRASSVVYPSGFNRRASRQSIKDEGVSLKPAAAEAYPLAALVGKTMENNSPNRRRGTYADIPATRVIATHSRNPSPHMEEMESPGGPSSRKMTLSPRNSNQTNSSLRGVAAADPRSISVPQSDNRDLQQMRAAYLNQTSMSPQSPKRMTTTAAQAQELFAAFPSAALQPPPPVLGQPATPPDPSHPIAEGTPLPPTFPPPTIAACDALSAAIGPIAVTPLLSIIPGNSAYQTVQQPVIAPSPLVVSPAILPPWTSSGMPPRLTDGGQSFIPIVYSSPMLGCNLDVPIYVGTYAHSGGASSATSRELTMLPFPAPAVAAQVMTRVEAPHLVPPPPYHIGRKNSIFEFPPEPPAGVLGD